MAYSEAKPVRIKSPAISITETEDEILIEFLSLDQAMEYFSSEESRRFTGGCELTGIYPNYSCSNNGCSGSCRVKETIAAGGVRIYSCACE
ncbi:hypothetical protein [Pseudanabaena sp. FACHB-2040]|uniref:hypothetical protein n=1 Tax=Pseudanabaena sp. FACHB-2040 TaxID=2692859 RepID=UPI001683CAB1|nr:hypothetical protein [Pseudanabaena sp. FACHB-2040]MBD2261025.1 hypothetical protein [Pseudanabaena sp. FACHB-2040]